jgi:hypothetical protein
MYTIKRRDFIVLVSGAAMILPAAADAVAVFPCRPIRLVVPYRLLTEARAAEVDFARSRAG